MKHVRSNTKGDKSPKGTKKDLAPRISQPGKKPKDIADEAKGRRAKLLSGKRI